MSEIVKYKKYVAGWLDSSIHDFLLSIPSAFPSIRMALITCLDSNRELGSLLESSPELKSLKLAQALDQGLFLPTSVLLESESTDPIMFGFDEVWFFPSESIRPKPPGPGLVGPRRITQSRLDELGQWMDSNSCSMAVGDGVGLNFVIKAEGLLRYFVGHSMNQSVGSNNHHS
jgi:hypothetical protein